MQLEFKTEVVELNEQTTATLEALQAQGWTMMPGVVPIAVYHLCRPIAQPVAEAPAAFGTLHIDESLVQIIRDGKVVN